MTESVLLLDLGLMVAGAALLSALTRRIGVPGVVAYMVAGLVLGPVTGLVEVTEAVGILSELGVAFLLFLVGLELSVDRAREVGTVALVAGTLQVVFTFGGGLALALLLGFSLEASLVVGLAVTFSSTAVVVKLLAERRELTTRSGRITIGILLVQDIVVVISLTLLGALGGEGAGAPVEGGGLALPFLALAGLGVVAWAAARSVLPNLFRWIRTTPDALFVWSITWCMLFVVGSEIVHLPLEIGAFIAGVALAQLPEAHALGRRLGPLTNFFLAVFFVALGIQMDPAAAGARPGAIVTLVAFVLLGKSLLLLGILGRSGEDTGTSFRTAVSLAQVSEFSFVLAALAAEAGYLDDTGLSVIGVVGLVTIAGSSLLLVQRDALYRRFLGSPLTHIVGRGPISGPGGAVGDRDGRQPTAEPTEQSHREGEDGHVIVVGMNTLGRALVKRLAREGHPVVAVDRDSEKLAGLPARTVIGDVERLDVLQDADMAGARLLVSALRIEDTNKLLAHQATEAGVPSSIHAFNPSVEEELTAAGASHLMDSRHEGARSFACHLRKLEVLGGSPNPQARSGQSGGNDVGGSEMGRDDGGEART